jgi:hypothetical protein
MLTDKLMKDLVCDAVKCGLNQRYPKWTFGWVINYNPQDGVVQLTVPLPSKNLSSIRVSLRGCDYMYKWLDRVQLMFPKMHRYLSGFDAPTEEFHDQIDWSDSSL